MKPVRTKLNIQMASRVAENYCEKNKLSISKLKAQKVIEIGDSIIFAQPTNMKTQKVALAGLRHDAETRPKPTLILKRDGSGYVVEETQYTDIYLK